MLGIEFKKMVKGKIIEALQKATHAVVGQAELSEKDVILEFPEREEFGDYSSNIALTMFSSLKIKNQKSKFKTPRNLAENVVEKLQNDKKLSKIVEKIEVAGPGFINFWLKSDVLVDNLIQIDDEKENYGRSDFLRGKKIMFEYGDANTHKLPHIGHIFSYIFGESVVRILEKAGGVLNRVSYQGDIGLHVAKCLWAFKKEKPKVPKSLEDKVALLQKMYQIGSGEYEVSDKVKEEIKNINKAIYEKDGEIHDLWKETRQWSLDYYKKFEVRLGIKYDRNYFESEVYEKGRKIVEENVGKAFEKSEGALIFRGSSYGLHDRVFVTKYGTPTYEAKDVYLQQLKLFEWSMDLLIITTASEQNEYFNVVFKALEVLDLVYVGKLKHIGFGMINLKTGKMSSRTGKVIGAIDLIDLTVKAVRKIVDKREDMDNKEKKETAESVGMGAVKYAFLKSNPLQNIKFDLEESISLEGNSGPYLQYTVARTNSVLAKTRSTKHEIRNVSNLNSEELSILRNLIRFSEVVSSAAKSYSPNILCNYLFDLAQKYNNFYNQHRIIGSENLEFRLRLTSGVGQVLKNGLNLLGIDSPERM